MLTTLHQTPSFLMKNTKTDINTLKQSHQKSEFRLPIQDLKPLKKTSKKWKASIQEMKTTQISHVILMGKITKSFQSEQHYYEFNEKIQTLNKHYQTSIVSGFVGTQGDEFQGLLYNLKEGFSLLLSLEKDFKDFPMRFVLGGVSLIKNIKINKERAWGLWGRGLSGSRHLLNASKKPYNIFLPKYPTPLEELLKNLNKFKNSPKQKEKISKIIQEHLQNYDNLENLPF